MRALFDIIRWKYNNSLYEMWMDELNVEALLMVNEVYRTKDDMGVLVVTQRGNKRVLSFGSDLEQSSIYIDKPQYLDHDYMQVMLLGLLFTESRHATILGLGGGALVHCVDHFFQNMDCVAVELRQIVIDTAYQWFKLPRTKRLQVHCADASVYLNSNKTSTDIIFSDIFNCEGMSESQGQIGFIQSCFDALKDNGCLVLNYHELPEAESTLIVKIKTLFPYVLVCNACTNNTILICLKQTQLFELTSFVQKSESLAHRVNMPLMYYFWRLETL